MKICPEKVRNRYNNSGQRTKDTFNNILLSLVSRVANIIAHLLVVPLTINYLNPERYGIWLTLSSVIAWVSFLDLGLGNGFRNRFAEAKAKGDILLARKFVSTTYCVVTLIILTALVIILLCNSYIDWSALLHVDSNYKHELNFVFAVVIIFTCLNMIANIFASLLSADQKVGYASIIQATGQYLSLIAIVFLSKSTEGSLSNLALFYSGIPCIVMFIMSILLFTFSRYRIYRPQLKLVELGLTKKIMNLGVQFFIIQICMIAVFQIVNIVISRELGPEYVTQYNITNKYFNVIYMTMTIVLTPFWSAFTDAYTKKDFSWMSSVYRNLNKLLSLSFLCYAIMVLVANYAYRLWIGNSVLIPLTITISMAIQVFSQTYCAVNLYLINGIGTVRLQTIVYMFLALVAWTSLTVSSCWGLMGIIGFVAVVYFVLGFVGQIQIHKILTNKASGIWLK